MNESEVDFSNLSIEERLELKFWKARLSAYTDISELFEFADEDNDPVFKKYANRLPTFLGDRNMNCQDQVIDLVSNFVDRYDHAFEHLQELVESVIVKLYSSRNSTSFRAVNLIYLLFQTSRPEIVESLVNILLTSGFRNKSPKVIIATVQTATGLLSGFGTPTIALKPFVPEIPLLMENRNSQVRNETIKLLMEIAKWIGTKNMNPFLEELPQTLQQSIRKQIERMRNEQPKATMFLRKPLVYEEKEDSKGSTQNKKQNEEKVINSWDLYDPVTVLTKIDSFYSQALDDQKWIIRRDMMLNINKALDARRMDSSQNYSDLVENLSSRIAHDSNIVILGLVLEAIKN